MFLFWMVFFSLSLSFFVSLSSNKYFILGHFPEATLLDYIVNFIFIELALVNDYKKIWPNCRSFNWALNCIMCPSNSVCIVFGDCDLKPIYFGVAWQLALLNELCHTSEYETSIEVTSAKYLFMIMHSLIISIELV